jgi:hypothetical protein
MTLIRPADRQRFTEAEWASINVWFALSSSATCACCGEPLAQLEDGRVQVPGSVGVGFASRIADEIMRYVSLPLMVVVNAAR